MSVIVQGMDIPEDEAVAVFILPDATARYWRPHSMVGQPLSAVQVPPHGRLIDEWEAIMAIIDEGQHDKRFKLGETIRYSPSEIKEIFERRVKTVVEAEE